MDMVDMSWREVSKIVSPVKNCSGCWRALRRVKAQPKAITDCAGENGRGCLFIGIKWSGEAGKETIWTQKIG
jgi:hypothetical protein